ncbi:MAG: hypothetical protein AAGF25_10935 [Pseudomonadota bacterium]
MQQRPFGRSGIECSADSATKPTVKKKSIPRKKATSIGKRIAQWTGLFVLCLVTIGIWGAALEDPEVRNARLVESAKRTQLAALDKAEEEKLRAAAERQKACDKRETMAFIMTQDRVKSRLRSPASAKFPWAHEIASKHTGNCKYEIFAYVDAQNGFGAMLRTYYSAKMQHDPSAETWRTLSLNILQ